MAGYVDTDNGKLLMISDLEGCASYGPPPSKAPQSQLLCDSTFFDAVEVFLTNEKNKVAFLGDYFDQGPKVVESINGIVNLYEKYQGRVHIILGNRDLNKLRLIYEMREKHQIVGDLKWKIWTKFYDELASKSSLMDRLKHILNTSMGAPGNLKLVPENELTEVEQAYLLLRAFSEQNAELLLASENSIDVNKINQNVKYINFINNVRTLFKAGKIVTYDDKFKTLLSHAGGAEPFLFHDEKYYENIKTKIKDLGYYDKIEKIRLLLQEAPADYEKVVSFDEKTYNKPLECIPSLFDNLDEPPEDYFLIQGLGLKPDEGEHFTSFIQSCDIQGCKGPYGNDLLPYEESRYKLYLNTLATKGIEAIAFGHSPHCAPIPVIYKRPETNILFIGNDTSNGYRPEAINTIENIPLSYVSFNQDNKLVAGVFSLPGSTENTYKGENDKFSPMIGTWTSETAPIFSMIPSPQINYEKNKALTFPARVEKEIPGIFKPALLIGGKRKSKKHRYTKNQKNIQKKHSNKTKKHRKSKKTCHHCKRH